MKPSTDGEGIFRRFPTLKALTLFSMLFSSVAYAGGTINADGWTGIAILGYDPVAYFTLDKAIEGSEEFTYEFLGAEWHFVNAEHRDMFAKNPLDYIPQYGGYCASAVSDQGQGTAMINPRAWRMVDGKLYLFYGERERIGWTQDDPAVARADAAWDRVKSSLE
jgi:YHS domain-containing protein